MWDRYRSECEDIIFNDFQSKGRTVAEAKLWKFHLQVNSSFRSALSSFRNGPDQKKVVEQRKMGKRYLDFIKSSQRFYRNYVQKLATRFGGIPELEAVAFKFNVVSVDTQNEAKQQPSLRQAVLVSCHESLIRLGDLSRYREIEMVAKERNWGPAIGYYDLARTIRPESGVSHNQLAVIEITEGNHLRATYYLYRALVVEEPHANAATNLELKFKKIINAWDKGELSFDASQPDAQGPGKALVSWFLRLHARCIKGVDFDSYDELENEVLSQLVIGLKERPMEATVQKFVLINIAAEFQARKNLTSAPNVDTNKQAFFFFQRINVRTFSTLLQILQPELERSGGGLERENHKVGPTKEIEKITVVARRVLPSLRHYSSWLLSNAVVLSTGISDALLDVQIKELWKIYASTLTLIAATFRVPHLPPIDYLLEEDEDTIGFKPFMSHRQDMRYRPDDSESLKPKWHNKGVERHHPNIEMLGRVRDFLVDGIGLVVDHSIPLDVVPGTTTFAYREEGLPSELLASPDNHNAMLSSTTIEREDISKANNDKLATKEADAQSESITANSEMNRMVNNLTEITDQDNVAIPDPSIPGFTSRVPPTPPDYSFNDSPSKPEGNDISYGLIGTLTAESFANKAPDPNAFSSQQPPLTPRPPLPSILNSPFAPLPGETEAHNLHSSRPGTAKGPLSSQTSQQLSGSPSLPLHPQPQPQPSFSSRAPAHPLSVPSSISSMQEPSSFLPAHASPTTRNPGNRAFFDPSFRSCGRQSTVYGGGNKSGFDDIPFSSSAIFGGSHLAGGLVGQQQQGAGNAAADAETPPGGQGGGFR
ncbi:hypothetical protein MMC20_002851 [Loxospora ochrophaea]|nr:hypothetical protein [Loxospora ochrophaea]